MAQWEYKQEKNLTMEQLKQEGLAEWELCGFSEHNGSLIYLFKKILDCHILTRGGRELN